jgi:hypothetical protein
MSLFNSTFVLPKFLLSGQDPIQSLSSGCHQVQTANVLCLTFVPQDCK